MSSDWLANLKVGDLALISGSFPTKVIRMTPTLIIVGRNRKFRKSDGREPPGPYGCELLEPTEERYDAIRQTQFAQKMKHFNWKSLPLDVLRKVNQLLPEKSK